MASLERLRELILRGITGTSKSSPVTALHLSGDRDNWFVDGSKNREGTGGDIHRKNNDMSFIVPLGSHFTVL